MSARPGPSPGLLAAGATGVIALGVGWFFLSWAVIDTPAADAAGEAIGVVFALLIVASVIGAIRSRR